MRCFENKKLYEEVDEYLENEDIEEMADVAEVLQEICIEKDFSKKEIEKIQLEKRFQRGSFTQGILLEYVEEK